jgi:hypothetical protein
MKLSSKLQLKYEVLNNVQQQQQELNQVEMLKENIY